jgi:hypothetical protein
MEGNTTYFEIPFERILSTVDGLLFERANDFRWMNFAKDELVWWLNNATGYLKRMCALAIAAKLNRSRQNLEDITAVGSGEADLLSTRLSGFLAGLVVKLPLEILEMVDKLGDFEGTDEFWRVSASDVRAHQLVAYAANPTADWATTLTSDYMMQSIGEMFPAEVLLDLPVIMQTAADMEVSVRPPADLDLDDEETCEDYGRACVSGPGKGAKEEFLGRGIIWRSRHLAALPEGAEKLALEEAFRRTFGLNFRVSPQSLHDIKESASLAVETYVKKYQEHIARRCTMGTFALFSGRGCPSQPLSIVRIHRKGGETWTRRHVLHDSIQRFERSQSQPR